MFYIESLLIVVLEVLCCKVFFETFGEKRKENGFLKNHGAIIGLMFFIFVAALLLSRYFLIKEFLIIVITAMIMKLYLEISFKKSIVFSAIFQALLLVIDYLSLILNLLFFNEVSQAESVLVILGKVFLFLIVLFIRKKMGNSLVAMTDMEWLRFIFFPVFTICMISAMIVTGINFSVTKQELLYFVVAFGLAGMNIVVLYLINDILKREVELRESQIFLLQVKNQIRMYRSISENFVKQKRKTHEYNNHILCIEALIKKENYIELADYVSELSGHLSKELEYISTNHVIIDAILNAKYQEILEKDILFVFKINDLSKVNISDEDIVVVLSNLLNNAIEACEQCQGSKIIKFKFVEEDDAYIISVKNTYEHKIIHSGSEIQTSKKDDVQEHGIGIKNIIETIEKYGGSYAMQDKENEFYFSIILPIKKE